MDNPNEMLNSLSLSVSRSFHPWRALLVAGCARPRQTVVVAAAVFLRAAVSVSLCTLAHANVYGFMVSQSELPSLQIKIPKQGATPAVSHTSEARLVNQYISQCNMNAFSPPTCTHTTQSTHTHAHHLPQRCH